MRMTADEETGTAAASMCGGATIELLVGTADSDPGDGLAGDNWQQFGACGEPSISAVGPTADFAIIGQCGRQCSEELLASLQQRLTPAAGPANKPNSRSNATTLERIFTNKTVLMVVAQDLNACDFGHTRS